MSDHPPCRENLVAPRSGNNRGGSSVSRAPLAKELEEQFIVTLFRSVLQTPGKVQGSEQKVKVVQQNKQDWNAVSFFTWISAERRLVASRDFF